MQKRRLPPGRADSCNWWCGGLISSGTYAMLGEVFGSVAGLVNSSGALATQYQYGAYGTTTTSGASSTNPFQYLGRELDPSGLYELRARYYNPIMGRFISPDPIGFAGGQSNLLEYSFNAPTDYFDPLGLQCSGGGFPCIGNGCDPSGVGLCNGAAGCPNAPIGRHGGGHKAPPVHLKFPTPVSPARSGGQATPLVAGADSIKLVQYLTGGIQPLLNPFQGSSFGAADSQLLPGLPPEPLYPELSYPEPAAPGKYLQLETP